MGQTPPNVKLVVPQAGTRSIASNVTFPTFSGDVETLAICNDAGTPVWPTTMLAGKFGVTTNPTPANAGEAAPNSTIANIASPTTYPLRTIPSPCVGPAKENPG